LAAEDFAPLVPQHRSIDSSEASVSVPDRVSFISRKGSKSKSLPPVSSRGSERNQSSLVAELDEARQTERSTSLRVAFGDTDVIRFQQTPPPTAESIKSCISGDSTEEVRAIFDIGDLRRNKRSVSAFSRSKQVLLVNPRFASLWIRKERSAVLLPNQKTEALEMGAAVVD
jgi:hypothetical protein